MVTRLVHLSSLCVDITEQGHGSKTERNQWEGVCLKRHSFASWVTFYYTISSSDSFKTRRKHDGPGRDAQLALVAGTRPCSGVVLLVQRRVQEGLALLKC